MHQVKIRHPNEGDELGVATLFAEIKGTMDEDSRDTYAVWLGQQEVIIDDKNIQAHPRHYWPLRTKGSSA